MSEKRNSLKLAELESSLPGFGEAAESALLLRAAMFEAISEADIGDIIKAQVAKAKSGDTKAAKFMLDVIGAAAPKTQFSVGIRANTAGSPPADEPKPRLINPRSDPEFEKADETPRGEVLRLLAKRGPMKVVDIAKELEYPTATISRAIGKDPHGWFALADGKYGITGVGREAVAE